MEEPITDEQQIRPFTGKLEGGDVKVSEKERFGELEGSGYGTMEGQALILKDYEALYLV